jgi:hypothetical protein
VYPLSAQSTESAESLSREIHVKPRYQWCG